MRGIRQSVALGLQYKLSNTLFLNVYVMLKSYLSDRRFQVIYQNEISALHNIRSWVLQGSVLGPVMYLLYVADLSTTGETFIAHVADDTAMASHKDPSDASRLIQ